MFNEAISMLHQTDNGNIILHQIISDNSILSIQEIKPIKCDSSLNLILGLDNNDIKWIPKNEFKEGFGIHISNIDGVIKIDSSIDNRVIIDDKIKDTNIYYNNERIGFGRPPMHSYKLDVAVPENTLMTAFHVGDGKYGFSMGNGTSNGFIPEIIGMGSDENDAGLYFIGRAGNEKSSDIPLIIIDGRNHLHQKSTNRPLFGVTNSDYNNYKFIIDQNGLVGIGKKSEIYKVEVNGSIKAKNFILDSSVSMNELIEIIIEQKTEIDQLKQRVNTIENSLK